MSQEIKSKWILIFALLGLGFLAHSFMISAEFKTMDDQFSIVNNEQIKNFSNLPQVFSTGYFKDESYYRPLVNFSYMLEYHFFGLNPSLYYLDNIIIHLLTSLTVFGLLWLLLENIWAAFLAGLLFAIHPIQWEAVANISGRAILMCALFYVNAFYQFCLALKGDRNYRNDRAQDRTQDHAQDCAHFGRFARKAPKVHYTLSLVFFLLALLSKESAIVLPIVLVSYLWFVARGRSPGGERQQNFFELGLVVIPYLAIFAVYFIFRKTVSLTSFFYWNSLEQSILGFLTFLKSIIIAVRLFIFPVDLHFDRSLATFLTFRNPEVWLTVLFYLLFLVFIFLKRRQIPSVIFFLMSWFFIDLLPVSQLIVTIGVQPGYISTAEHFLYTPSIGIFACAVWLCYALSRQENFKKLISRGAFRFAVAGIFLFFFILTVQNNIYARTEVAMFRRALEFEPHNVRLRNSLGLLFARYNLYEEAEQQFRWVLKADPLNARARIGLGKALCDQGKYWEGILEYNKVQDPGDLKDLLKNNLKLTYDIVIAKRKELLPIRGAHTVAQTRTPKGSEFGLRRVSPD